MMLLWCHDACTIFFVEGESLNSTTRVSYLWWKKKGRERGNEPSALDEFFFQQVKVVTDPPKRPPHLTVTGSTDQRLVTVQLVDQVDCNVNVEKHRVTLLRCIYLNVYKLSLRM